MQNQTRFAYAVPTQVLLCKTES